MKFQNGWMEIKPIKKTEFSEPTPFMGKIGDDVVYFERTPMIINGKYFINESQIIAYERN